MRKVPSQIGGGGVTFEIFVDGISVFNFTVGGFDTVGSAFGETATVGVGSTVDFVVGPNGFDSFDSTALKATITSEDVDTDGDGVPDEEDNCPETANADQDDVDGDGIGDVCDPVRDVTIDIKPGSFPNSINQDNNGVIPVAILGSETFDATTVDGSTCTLGEAEVKIVGRSDKLLCSVEDVNDDGFLDQVCKFVTIDLGAELGDTEATIYCSLPEPITGTDSIRIVPPE